MRSLNLQTMTAVWPASCCRLLSMVLLLVSATASAQHIDERDGDAVDQLVEHFMAERRIPGVAVAILEDGEVIKVQGYGLADLEHSVPVTVQTLFETGSLGKHFTAAAVLLLAEDGRLSLQDPISQHLEEAPPSWDAITLQHLLTHTSGLPPFESRVNRQRDYTERELMKLIAEPPLLFEPGTNWSYSNAGYVVLGNLVSRLTGAHWGEFLEQRVFAEAGMETAQVISQAKIVPHRASGYELENGELRNAEWFAPSFLTTGDGSLYQSIMDLVRWDQALRGGTILSPRSRELWWTPARLNDGTEVGYGFGWEVMRGTKTALVEHGGIMAGFHSYLVRYEDPALTVAVLANVHLGGRDMAYERALAYDLVYLQRPELAETAPATRAALAHPLQAYAGEFLTPEGDTLTIKTDTHGLLVDGLSSEVVVYQPIGANQFINAGPGVHFANHLRFVANADGFSEAWLGHRAESPLIRLRRIRSPD